MDYRPLCTSVHEHSACYELSSGARRTDHRRMGELAESGHGEASCFCDFEGLQPPSRCVRNDRLLYGLGKGICRKVALPSADYLRGRLDYRGASPLLEGSQREVPRGTSGRRAQGRDGDCGGDPCEYDGFPRGQRDGKLVPEL